MDTAWRRKELGSFLRSCRASLRPEDVGLRGAGRRSTPGLRREEVAVLAHVSVTWYTALEQGRDIRVSDEVLDSISTALRLDPAARQHVFELARPALTLRHPLQDAPTAASLAILHALTLPAFLFGARGERLAWNSAAAALFPAGRLGAGRQWNRFWNLLTDENIRSLFQDWEQYARQSVADLRARSARFIDDPAFQQLLADLQGASPEFREWWPLREPRDHRRVPMTLNHPRAGKLVLEPSLLELADEPGLHISVLTPVPGTSTAARLHALLLNQIESHSEA